ncbi:hypothetical protein [Fructobacillus americanaquae]|uniref:Aminopyrimidine aminohydrolase n=1 Tax=Fructobacillus americanaquae TaxID=2940302 RepID=A0ABY5C0C5_9LACO|nr:hypothetical protein [Fructobacillus americanaquae]USS92214.1 hypothetical protein M3M36_00955 [Fructobacillus americanaquae]
MTKTLPFSNRLMQVMEEHKANFYANPFIQAMIAGEVNSEALLYYVQQDYRYLGHYLPLYEQVCQTLTGQTIDAEVADDDREGAAHKILLDLAQTDDKSIQAGRYPNLTVTDQYVNHMAKAVEKDPFIGLVALTACPYDYAYLADLLIRDGLIKPDNPFIPWVGYYRGLNKGLTRPSCHWSIRRPNMSVPKCKRRLWLLLSNQQSMKINSSYREWRQQDD